MVYRDRVPYSKVGLEMLAQAMNVSTAAIWINPVNNGLSVRDYVSASTKVSGRAGDHSASGLAAGSYCELEEELE